MSLADLKDTVNEKSEKILEFYTFQNPPLGKGKYV